MVGGRWSDVRFGFDERASEAVPVIKVRPSACCMHSHGLQFQTLFHRANLAWSEVRCGTLNFKNVELSYLLLLTLRD